MAAIKRALLPPILKTVKLLTLSALVKVCRSSANELKSAGIRILEQNYCVRALPDILLVVILNTLVFSLKPSIYFIPWSINSEEYLCNNPSMAFCLFISNTSSTSPETMTLSYYVPLFMP